jgi:GNAT superfamily N-acetyltransferase
MLASDLPEAHRLSQAVRWPHRLEDWQFVAALGTGFVAEEAGAVIGTALCWPFDARHGALGLVIVAPEAQGGGIGKGLMARVLDALGDRITFLHATPAGQPLYEKLGFVACGSVTQHQAVVGDVASVTPLSGDTLREGSAADLPHLIDLAWRSAGIDHRKTLEALAPLAQSVVLERDGDIVGCAFIRRFGRGYVVGPVYAERDENATAAKVMISHWLAANAGQFLRVDVAGHAALSAWLVDLGLPNVDTGVKMVRHATPDDPALDETKPFMTYAILNQAMG